MPIVRPSIVGQALLSFYRQPYLNKLYNLKHDPKEVAAATSENRYAGNNSTEMPAPRSKEPTRIYFTLHTSH